jgi:bla regulator protein BlaR1
MVALLLVFTISKAALISDKNTYKTMATTFNEFGIHVKTGRTATQPIAINSKTVMVNVTIKTAPLKIVDTTRKGDTFTSATVSSDTLTYVINGKKVTKAAFKALDPDQIYAIEIVTGEAAAKIIDNIDSKHDVLFVTTDDSDTGKKFKEKLDELNVNGSINNARSVSVYGFSQSRAPGSGYSGVGVIVPDSNFSALHYNRKELKLHKFKALPKTTYTITADSLYTNEAPVVVGVGTDSASVYELRGDKSTAKLYTYKVRPYANQAWGNARSMPNKTFLYSPKAIIVNDRGFNRETNIDHLSSKIIIVDGKEATESDMKKLSAADIENMSIKSGDDITKKYGSKAKNGVVFITTKKK